MLLIHAKIQKIYSSANATQYLAVKGHYFGPQNGVRLSLKDVFVSSTVYSTYYYQVDAVNHLLFSNADLGSLFQDMLL